MKSSPLQICDASIQPGEKVSLAFPTPEIYTCIPMHIPIHVIHGRKKGPVLIVCAAIHGDQTNGVEIIRRLLDLKLLNKIHGTLIAVPVVNVYGLMARSRNLADGRDLEGSFPGSETGSFASRLAYFFNKKILQMADYCIDIHTAQLHIEKLPQIHTDLENEEAKKLAKIFNAPVICDSKDPRSLLFLMQKESEKKIPTLLYEAGEALRLNESVIKIGIRGIINVMKELKMLKTPPKIKFDHIATIKKYDWVFSSGSGICNFYKKLGSHVKQNDLIAKVFDPFGTRQTFEMRAPFQGIIVALKNLPLISEGEPIVNIAQHFGAENITDQITSWQNESEE